MNNLNFTAIDFETANEQRSSVCALGIVIVEKGIISDRKYRLIKPPELRFNPRNINVHRILPRDVENELEFYKYWKSLKEIFEKHTVVAHNAGFDISVLSSVLETYQLDFPKIDYSCSLRISRRSWLGLNSYSLGPLGRYLGYKFSHHHALEDAEMCANLVIDACHKTKSNSLDELHFNLKISPGKLFSDKNHIKIKSDKILKI